MIDKHSAVAHILCGTAAQKNCIYNNMQSLFIVL